MSLINYKKKYRCGVTTTSSCVSWEEGYNNVITVNAVGCDASVGDVVLEVSEHVEDIEEQIDLSQFSSETLDFDNDTDKLKDLLQELADKLQEAQETIANLQEQITAVANGDIQVEVDLACLSSEISNCETPPTYSIASLFELLINQHC